MCVEHDTGMCTPITWWPGSLRSVSSGRSSIGERASGQGREKEKRDAMSGCARDEPNQRLSDEPYQNLHALRQHFEMKGMGSELDTRISELEIEERVRQIQDEIVEAANPKRKKKWFELGIARPNPAGRADPDGLPRISPRGFRSDRAGCRPMIDGGMLNARCELRNIRPRLIRGELLHQASSDISQRS
jgi:hypothetical protein